MDRLQMSPSVREISPAEAQDLIDQGAALLDTREQHEWRAGHLNGATLVPPIEVAARVEDVVPDKTKPVVIYCAAGARSMRAALQLAQMGYQDVYSVAGGIGRWKAEGRPWELPERNTSRSRRIRAMRVTWSCLRLVRRVRASCSRRRCCSSVPGAWAHQACSIWRPRASGRSASSTSTSSISATCSARSSTLKTASA